MKQKLMFFVYEITPDEAFYVYRVNLIFDELLSFYAFLNSWSVQNVKSFDSVEKFYYCPDAAIDTSELLLERVI